MLEGAFAEERGETVGKVVVRSGAAGRESMGGDGGLRVGGEVGEMVCVSSWWRCWRKAGCWARLGTSGMGSEGFVRKAGCSSMDGMLEKMLLRSATLGTVEGGGDGSRGWATMRRGGERGRSGEMGFSLAGISETDDVSC